MEIRRFGVGNRRPDGPPGTMGVAGRVIHADGRGVISELAFARRAAMEPHSNPNTTWFVVIEGGGWVQVGDERARIAGGEAALWPADVVHAAWTELTEMRAIVVELAGADDAQVRGFLEAGTLPPGSGQGSATGAASADGGLRPTLADPRQPAVEGEPL
jgi:quercetin dioxygenase-like cupin family protein